MEFVERLVSLFKLPRWGQPGLERGWSLPSSYLVGDSVCREVGLSLQRSKCISTVGKWGPYPLSEVYCPEWVWLYI